MEKKITKAVDFFLLEDVRIEGKKAINAYLALSVYQTLSIYDYSQYKLMR